MGGAGGHAHTRQLRAFKAGELARRRDPLAPRCAGSMTDAGQRLRDGSLDPGGRISPTCSRAGRGAVRLSALAVALPGWDEEGAAASADRMDRGGSRSSSTNSSPPRESGAPQQPLRSEAHSRRDRSMKRDHGESRPDDRRTRWGWPRARGAARYPPQVDVGLDQADSQTRAVAGVRASWSWSSASRGAAPGRRWSTAGCRRLLGLVDVDGATRRVGTVEVSMAAWASSSVESSVTKPKPRGRPVSRSIITWTSVAVRPPALNASRMVC